MNIRVNLIKEEKNMLLSHKTDIQLNTTESNIVGHMCYAASKLWNVCNYERRNFKELEWPITLTGMIRKHG